MAVVKVIEIIAQSDQGFDDAVRNAVAEAGKTVKNIQSVYVKDMEAKVDNQNVTMFRVTAKVSFLVEN